MRCLFASLSSAIFCAALLGLAVAPAPRAAAQQGNVSVLDFGADPSGQRDSAPAFRAAIDASSDITVPQGRYLFKSAERPTVCCAFNPSPLFIKDRRNFRITGHNAQIIVDPLIAKSATIHIADSANFEISGLIIHGSREGLTPNIENVAITLNNVMNFKVHDNVIRGGYQGLGSAFAGDWMINGEIYKNRLSGVGQCFDFAFARNLKIYSNVAVGQGVDGGPGAKCVSFIQDGPNLRQNRTGTDLRGTENITITNNQVSNFTVGANITSGSGFTFSGNVWRDNPGRPPHGAGIGIFVHYTPAGPFASVGAPPQRITIEGDKFIRNGSAVAGAGVSVAPPPDGNADWISTIVVRNGAFEGNNGPAVKIPMRGNVRGVDVSSDSVK